MSLRVLLSFYCLLFDIIILYEYSSLYLIFIINEYIFYYWIVLQMDIW